MIGFQEDFVRFTTFPGNLASSPRVIFLFPCLISDEQKQLGDSGSEHLWSREKKLGGENWFQIAANWVQHII